MARVIYTDYEREKLSPADMALLQEYILNVIQTSPEIRRIISQRRRQFVQLHPRIRRILRSKADPLLRLLQSKSGGAGGGRKKKKGGRKKKK